MKLTFSRTAYATQEHAIVAKTHDVLGGGGRNEPTMTEAKSSAGSQV